MTKLENEFMNYIIDLNKRFCDPSDKSNSILFSTGSDYEQYIDDGINPSKAKKYFDIMNKILVYIDKNKKEFDKDTNEIKLKSGLVIYSDPVSYSTGSEDDFKKLMTEVFD